MAITFGTSVFPQQLVCASVRVNTADTFVSIPGAVGIAWRPETVLSSDYQEMTLTANMRLYKPLGSPFGYGRRVVGELYLKDVDAAEKLVAYSHLNSGIAANTTFNADASLQLAVKINTGINTNNLRYMTKLFQPVAFGVGWGGTGWPRSLIPLHQKGDAGDRSIISLPFIVLLQQANTHFNTTNTSNAGVYTGYTNTSNSFTNTASLG